MTLRGTGGYNTAIPYVPSGRLALGPGSVRLCKNSETARARMITAMPSGRIRLAQNNSDGVPLKSDGPMENCLT